jgi:hypothetical protein
MSEDLSKAKRAPGSILPESGYDASSGIERVEAFITPSVLRSRFLFGFPLVSPLTKEKVTDEMLLDYIKRASNMAETECGTNFSPVMRRIRQPFSIEGYMRNQWFESPFKPIISVKQFFIASPSFQGEQSDGRKYQSGPELFVIPNDWVDVSYSNRGRLFVSPLATGLGFVAAAAPGAGTTGGSNAYLLQSFLSFVPALWTVEALTGFCAENGSVPVIVNEAVGARSAWLILNDLIPLYRFTSQSLGVDGLSQGVGDSQAQLLTQKQTQLDAVYRESCKKIRAQISSSGFVSSL